MSSSDPPHNDADFALIRTIGRVAQLLLDLRAEYERRPNEYTVMQIRQRIHELGELEKQLRSGDVRAAS